MVIRYSDSNGFKINYWKLTTLQVPPLYHPIKESVVLPILVIALALSTPIVARESPTNLGEAYYNQQYYEEAIPHLETQYHQNGEIRHARMLGHAYYHLLKYSEALPLLIQVIESEPDDIESKIAVSDILLNQQHYTEAEGHLNYLIQHAAEHAMVWVLSARLHVSQKDTASAIHDYEKAASLDPLRASLFAIELLTLYIDSDNKTRASEFGRQIVEINPAAFEVVEIKTRLKQMNEQAIGNQKERRPYTLRAGYLLELDNYLLVEPDNGDPSAGYERKSDIRHVVTARATLKHPLKESGELYGDGSLYQSLHATQSEFNLIHMSLMGGVHWSLKNGGVRIPYRFTHTILDNNFYSKSHTLSPQYYLKESKRESLHVKLTLQDNEYQFSANPDEQRSGSKIGLELGRQHSLYKNQLYGSYRFSVDRNNSDGNNWDYQESKLSAYFSYRHSNKLRSSINLSYGIQDFDHIHSSYGVVRADHFYDTSINISYWMTKEMELKASTLWNDRHSNIDFYDYSRNITSFGLNWYFQ